MIHTPTKSSQKLQVRWRGQMRVLYAKRHLKFKVENIIDGSRLVAYAQRLLPYLATRRGEQAFIELKRHPKYYDTKCHFVEDIRDNRKRDDKYEVHVRLIEFEDRSNGIWEAFDEIKEELPCSWKISVQSHRLKYQAEIS